MYGRLIKGAEYFRLYRYNPVQILSTISVDNFVGNL